jgi:hypothetical protein
VKFSDDQMTRFRITLLLIFLFLVTGFQGYSQDPLLLVRQMIATTNNFRSLQFTLETRERVNGRFVREVNVCKMNSNPYKFYAVQSVPVKKLEVLYVAGNNGNKLKISPASFPWVTMNLHPESPLVLNNRHHSVLDAGFNYICQIIESLLQKYESKGAQIIDGFSKVKVFGTDCYAITLTNPFYKVSEIEVKGKETPLTLARKLNLNFYTILENNPGLKINDVINTGNRLAVPNDYGSRIELYIHQDKLYPVDLKVYDSKGLYEEYIFTDVDINPVFDGHVFSPENPTYSF